jgi:hypothetical protein
MQGEDEVAATAEKLEDLQGIFSFMNTFLAVRDTVPQILHHCHSHLTPLQMFDRSRRWPGSEIG